MAAGLPSVGSSWGSSFEESTATSFEDLASLESGLAREFVPAELLMPPEHWWLCRIKRSNKNQFVMELERTTGSAASGRPVFVLSARRVGDDFYISRYEDFASEGSEGQEPSGRFCAVVRAPSRSGKKKAKAGERRSFHLIPAALGVSRDAPISPLATIFQSWFKQPECGAEIRCVDVELPEVCRGPEALYVWDDGKSARISAAHSTHVGLASQIPRWDKAHGCLVMKFQRGRVKESSSKNFILFKDAEAGRGRSVAPIDPSKAVLQFGKASDDEYALDFRGPIAPLHAFALALSSFAFRI